MASFVRNIAFVILSLFGLAQVHAEEPQSASAMLRFGGFLGGGGVDWVGRDADGSLPGDAAVPRPGFSAGVLVTLNMSRLLSLGIAPFHLAVQPELVYATKGVGLESYGEDRGVIDMRYFQTALLLRAEYSTKGRVTPYFLVGPELSFLRRAEVTNRFGMTSDIARNLKSTDLGLILGLGTMFEVPPYGALGLELRGDLGLVSIDGQGDGDEIRNAALTLLLVYLY